MNSYCIYLIKQSSSDHRFNHDCYSFFIIYIYTHKSIIGFLVQVWVCVWHFQMYWFHFGLDNKNVENTNKSISQYILYKFNRLVSIARYKQETIWRFHRPCVNFQKPWANALISGFIVPCVTEVFYRYIMLLIARSHCA